MNVKDSKDFLLFDCSGIDRYSPLMIETRKSRRNQELNLEPE